MRNEEVRLPDSLAYRNVEAEQSVLGSALQSKKAVDLMREMDISCFTEPENRVLCEAILEVDAKGQPVDLVTIHTALSEQNKLDMIGGTVYLMQLINTTPTPSAATSAATIRNCI